MLIIIKIIIIISTCGITVIIVGDVLDEPSLYNKTICIQYSQVLVIFLFSKYSDSFLIWQFYSYCYFSFSTFHNEHGIFFYANFHSYILTTLFQFL